MTNKKKALVIFGSPHKNSFTASICSYFTKRLTGYDTELVNAFESNFRPCIDCKKCRQSKTCVFRDMDNFDFIFRQSDLIIIASPLYNFSFPSPLKAIFDRFQRYYSEKYYLNLKLPQKSAILILTCGRQNNDKWIEIFKNQTNILLESINIKLIHTIYIKNTDNLKSGVDNLSENVKININDIVKNL